MIPVSKYDAAFARLPTGEWGVKVPWQWDDFEKSAQLDLGADYFPREEGSKCRVHKRDGTITTVQLGAPLDTVWTGEHFEVHTLYKVKER